MHMNTSMPNSVKACLWSYNLNRIDFSVPEHRKILIQNILNRGTSEAVSWLKNNFNKEQIVEVVKKSNVSEWNKKSLALWSLIYNTSPSKNRRFN